jgi:mannose-1-phosphate guanylyltransferase
VVAQPEGRGTAPAILYGLLRVAATAPMATVAVLPSDHYVSDDAAFMAHVDAAFEVVRARPDLVVLLGIAPDGPETGYGWIEPGDRIESGPSRAVFRVRRFCEKPERRLAEALCGAGGLWNSFVIVARAPALLALIRRAAPSLYGPFEHARSAIGTAAERETIEALYSRLPAIDFSASVLASLPANLAVLKVNGVVWSDLGEPARVKAALARSGIEPEGARATALA